MACSSRLDTPSLHLTLLPHRPPALSWGGWEAQELHDSNISFHHFLPASQNASSTTRLTVAHFACVDLEGGALLFAHSPVCLWGGAFNLQHA